MRRRTVRFSVLVVAVALALAVQWDTPVRRWLVPVPAARPLLDRRVPEIRFSTHSFDDAVAHLSRTAGVVVRYEARERTGFPWPDQPVPLPPFERTFRGATVGQVLAAIVRHWRPRLYVGGAATEREGAIQLRPHWPDGGPLVLRVYDVAGLVPPPILGLPPQRTLAVCHIGLPDDGGRSGALSAIQDEVETAAHVHSSYYLANHGPVPFAARVTRRGSRLFVYTDAASHRTVADLLASMPRVDAAAPSVPPDGERP